MKKKLFFIFLLTIGILLLCIPVLLAIKEAASINIIGGAGWSTVRLVFFRMHHGLYFKLSGLGILCIIASTVVALKKKKK